MKDIIDNNMANASEETNKPLDNNQAGTKESFAVYRTFADKQQLLDFVAQLDSYGILSRTNDSSTQLDASLIGAKMPVFSAEIMRKDFKTVNAILAKEIQDNYTDEQLEDHYLNDLSDQELYGIIEKPDEWTQESIIIARMLLQLRGITVTDDTVEKNRQNAISKLKQTREVSQKWIVFYAVSGALSGFWFFFIWGILTAVGMGIYYISSRETDIDGNIYQVFGPKTRKGGIAIFVATGIGILAGMLFWEFSPLAESVPLFTR